MSKKQKSKHILVTIPKEQVQQIYLAAAKLEISANKYIALAAIEKVKRDGDCDNEAKTKR